MVEHLTSGFKGDDFVIAKWSRYSVKVICFLYLINRSGYAYPVIIAERSHLFPSRTQQLSSSAPRIPGGLLPGKLGRCRFFENRVRKCSVFFFAGGDTRIKSGTAKPAKYGCGSGYIREANEGLTVL